MKILNYNLHKYFILLLIALLFSGCQSVRINGQFIDDRSVKEIEGKKLNKDEVTNLIGSPTVVPDYSPDHWYYIQRTVSQRAWFEPKILEQKITEVVFDSKGYVSKVLVYENMNLEEIASVKEYTKTHGTDENGLQKFIKNIGRFNKKS
jgi:outer membrane protein assembly factor BamE (lipoprotein component of BamABCDE complex)